MMVANWSKTMKIAMPVWEGRVSPLFDVARQLLIVEIEEGREMSRWEVSLEEEWPPNRVSRLVDLTVEVLICGGISRLLADSLRAAGITVISQIKGKAEQILAAFLNGEFPSPRFSMPGATVPLKAMPSG
jgi:predicted Fe-Mo cluster-binding NifX family protein